MVSLEWCARQSKGAKLTVPNDNLAREYFSSAEETLDVLKEISNMSNMWLATTKYYCEYFTVYALFMKLGIKSEIHDCTIAICSFLEKEDLLPKGTYEILKEDKQLRIDNQYYLKNKPVKVNYENLLNFVLTIKNIANTLSLDKSEEIRSKLKKILNQ